MTIAEKSNQLPEGNDLAQLALEKFGVAKCEENGVHHCFMSPKEKGSNVYIYNKDNQQISFKPYRWKDTDLPEGSAKEAVETAFKNWLNEQEFVTHSSGSNVGARWLRRRWPWCW